jgi:hypothetical protein
MDQEVSKKMELVTRPMHEPTERRPYHDTAGDDVGELKGSQDLPQRAVRFVVPVGQASGDELKPDHEPQEVKMPTGYMTRPSAGTHDGYSDAHGPIHSSFPLECRIAGNKVRAAPPPALVDRLLRHREDLGVDH